MIIKFASVRFSGKIEHTEFRVNSAGWLQKILESENMRSVRTLALIKLGE